ncbi:nuclear transport factor 2 family protein [Hymenobacter cellulosivorans]|uniref:Nuclear transport factor 2 family protein n=1 Tax=Hymenobacter cellulosivorans TaxID=2932249 RepID=A0ABY4FAV6_9BACT|nr:nuclear transport factor 2 family protein [Hymenobacter cellulosivorans]UOQ53629.1 nuclear transport factor 2 family protein [Hymenobacter cellulosivorans]
MDAAKQKQLVQDYIEAYNRLDVAGMLQPLHEEVVFRNVTNGEVDLTLTGKDSFRQQAEQALQYFSQREQRVTDWQISADKVEVQLDYSAVAAMDFPNGLKAGDPLQLQGKSVFEFADGLISSITDIS